MTKIESFRFTYAGPDTVLAEITTADGATISYSMSTATLFHAVEGGTATINANLGNALADVLCKPAPAAH